MEDESLYDILGVSEDAAEAEIREAHRHLLMRVHPDQGGSDALCRVVQQAYETLSDPAARERYDSERKSGRRPSPQSEGAREEDTTGDTSEWQSAEPADDDPPTAVAPPSTWTQISRELAAWPSVTVLVGGATLLVIGMGIGVFGLGFWGVLFVLLGLNGVWGRYRASRLGLDALRRSDMGEVDAMSGIEFEHYLVQLFRAEGFSVLHVGGPGDFGADLLAGRDGELGVVQAKRMSSLVGQEAVREVVAAKGYYGAQHAMVITNWYFRPSAETLAESNDVDLWDRTILAELASRHSSKPAPSGLALGWAEFRWGLPGSLRLIWFIFLLFLSSVALFAQALSPPQKRRRTSRRHRRR